MHAEAGGRGGCTEQQPNTREADDGRRDAGGRGEGRDGGRGGDRRSGGGLCGGGKRMRTEVAKLADLGQYDGCVLEKETGRHGQEGGGGVRIWIEGKQYEIYQRQ